MQHTVAELNRKSPTCEFGRMNLYFKSSSELSATKSVDPKYTSVIAMAHSVVGTPYTSANLYNVTGIVKNGTLTLHAYGLGFVSGHVLDVCYLLFAN